MKGFASFSCVFVIFSSFNEIQTAGKCPAVHNPPSECFSLEEIMDYGSTSYSMEKLYNQYVDKLTEADFTIDGNEVCLILVDGNVSYNNYLFLLPAWC